MKKVDLHKVLDGKWEDGTRPKDLYKLYISEHPEKYSETIAEGLRGDNRRIQNGCAELASLLSEKYPKSLYSHMPLFIENLRAKEPVLRWEAACTIGNLAAVDKDKQIPAHLPVLFEFLHDKSIVLQGHSVKALAKCAKVYPEKAPEIFKKLTGAKENFPGNRIGYLIEAMDAFAKDDALKKKVIRFVEAYKDSDIKSVAKKAEKVLKKL